MFRKLILILFLLVFSVCGCKNSSTGPDNPDNPVKTVMDNYSLDSLVENIKVLSGEKQAFISGQLRTIQSRYQKAEGNEYAAQFIKTKLKNFGLSPYEHIYSTTGKNIIAVQEGENKNQYFIICAHYDSMPPGTVAPGADDNASGVATVLEAARILTKQTLKYSVIYALWDEEEVGLIGSNFYANDIKNDVGKNIKYVINIDMIGYDEDGDLRQGAYKPDNDQSNYYFNLIKDVAAKYKSKVSFSVINYTASSDDKSFSSKGFPTIGFVEDYTSKEFYDFNPYWHKTEDKLDKFNMQHFEGVSKLIISALYEFTK